MHTARLNFGKPRSAKNHTCYYWSRGHCKFDEASCLYAHSYTGRMAEEPVPAGDTGYTVAGRNSIAAKPILSDWRSVHPEMTQEKSEVSPDLTPTKRPQVEMEEGDEEPAAKRMRSKYLVAYLEDREMSLDYVTDDAMGIKQDLTPTKRPQVEMEVDEADPAAKRLRSKYLVAYLEDREMSPESMTDDAMGIKQTITPTGRSDLAFRPKPSSTPTSKSIRPNPSIIPSIDPTIALGQRGLGIIHVEPTTSLPQNPDSPLHKDLISLPVPTRVGFVYLGIENKPAVPFRAPIAPMTRVNPVTGKSVGFNPNNYTTSTPNIMPSQQALRNTPLRPLSEERQLVPFNERLARSQLLKQALKRQARMVKEAVDTIESGLTNLRATTIALAKFSKRFKPTWGLSAPAVATFLQRFNEFVDEVGETQGSFQREIRYEKLRWGVLVQDMREAGLEIVGNRNERGERAPGQLYKPEGFGGY